MGQDWRRIGIGLGLDWVRIVLGLGQDLDKIEAVSNKNCIKDGPGLG